MDIHAWRLPGNATAKQVESFLAISFAKCGIEAYHCEKRNGKFFANITVLDVFAANRFLDRYGVPPRSGNHARPREGLRWDGRFIGCTKSNQEANPFSLKCLALAASEKARKATASSQSQTKTQMRDTTRFAINSFECGVWDYTDGQLVFVSHFRTIRRGMVSFGANQVAVVLADSEGKSARIDIHYNACNNIVLGGHSDPAITFTLRNAPRFYTVLDDYALADAQMASITIAPGAKTKSKRKNRTTGIDAKHDKVAGVCFVYRLTLSSHLNMSGIRALLSGNSKAPAVFPNHFSSVIPPTESMNASFVALEFELSDQGRFGSKPFALLYQLKRLALNGVLHPRMVISLLPKVALICSRSCLEASLWVLRQMVHRIPMAGPETDAEDLSQQALECMLDDLVQERAIYRNRPASDPYDLAKRFSHMNLIHRVIVTPCGVYLEGPEAEPTNRVIRKYSTNTDNFVRVIFQDEDGSSVRYDSLSSNDYIFDVRFGSVLDRGIIIAGKSFGFLGFSHSSLRAQCCWFMASFWTDGRLKDPSLVLKELGDFTHIRIPAKCAARIGQNFTDTNATIDLDKTHTGELEMVRRDGYDFGDGVGTISYGLLEKVWQKYGQRRALKPTAIQIRYKGYKGMVALDSRLTGERLMLRENMKKYDASAGVCNLEICGAGFRPLPMVLNRLFIKIFEDLGIDHAVFMDLQKTAVDKLRAVATSASATAAFLEESECSRATQLPALVRYLHEIGLAWQHDQFLSGVMEIAMVTKLREIKYRGRIPVKKGVTLFGIMDETGELKEGEIYVVTQYSPNTGRHVLVQDRVVVTRSPAYHPGDVQIVSAVDVSADSPLQQLANVVVFSKNGTRDLPSQLSGGDLDGDLYNVIFDPRLVPVVTHQAAQYPRVSAVALDRNVTAKDMSDFFVTFMKADLLGCISTMHMQLADQSNLGTFDPGCIKLASMASTAVDFSKTGIPVDMTDADCPRMNRYRPDFMSPSPRIITESDHSLILEDEIDKDEEDAFEALDAERRPYRYYESQKILGKLFRDIDERRFFDKMHQDHHRTKQTSEPNVGEMHTLLSYMKREASRYGILYDHQRDLARDIRAGYEDSLLDILYNCAPTPNLPVSEHEAFAGTILGRKTGKQDKPLRELSKTMREHFGLAVEYIVMRIVKGDEQMIGVSDLDLLYEERDIDREVEAFPRALACLEVALEEKGKVDPRLGELESFKYIAAGVCLKELEKLGRSMGSYVLPMV